jgi:hypothetical protein
MENETENMKMKMRHEKYFKIGVTDYELIMFMFHVDTTKSSIFLPSHFSNRHQQHVLFNF